MRTPRTRAPRSEARAGFTIVELLVATSVAMVLLYGALFSTMESFAVVRQGDTRVNTQIHARRTLERLTKDIRYASALDISGDAESGWVIDLETGIDADAWTWTWDPDAQSLTVSDGATESVVVQGLQEFSLDTALEGTDIAQVVMVWTVAENAGEMSGPSGSTTTVTIPSSTWVRRFAP